ncbi:hypothetical protein ONZ45_g2099 [Pleurotus djamor]|nr:hypothetical protein ONZ45_g2099 [Pleurotus djamor]
MSYPLQALPTKPEQIATMDHFSSRERLKLEMAFMKNVFAQALNTLHKVAPAVEASRSAFVPFLDYAGLTSAFLLLHIEGDGAFHRHEPSENGKTIQSVLGNACNPPTDGIVGEVKKLQAMIETLRKVAAIDSKKLAEQFSEEALNKMMFDNMTWFGQQAGVEALIPYIISHHDTATSKHWPCIPPEALAALPELVKKNSACWQFAPMHPTTKAPSPWGSRVD